MAQAPPASAEAIELGPPISDADSTYAPSLDVISEATEPMSASASPESVMRTASYGQHDEDTGHQDGQASQRHTHSMDIIRESSEASLAADHSAVPTDGLSTFISHPSQVEEKPTARSEQNAGEPHSTSEKEAGTNARNGRSALLNLPPPLPFDLAVTNLWVGVPHRGPSS
jgi:hypothetical protein